MTFEKFASLIIKLNIYTFKGTRRVSILKSENVKFIFDLLNLKRERLRTYNKNNKVPNYLAVIAILLAELSEYVDKIDSLLDEIMKISKGYEKITFIDYQKKLLDIDLSLPKFCKVIKVYEKNIQDCKRKKTIPKLHYICCLLSGKAITYNIDFVSLINSYNLKVGKTLESVQ